MKTNIISWLNSFLIRSFKINDEKRRIRFEIRLLKNKLSNQDKLKESEIVFEKIESLPEFKAANTILIYWSTKDELPTHEIVKKWRNEKFVVLPSIKNKNLVLKKFTKETEMVQHALGIWEPDLNEVYTGKVDLAIVPGVAFDKNKNRLGRGKGYYDRFFRRNKTLKIGVGFDFQLIDFIPVRWWDRQMDKIVTPSNTIE
jgi:5-formyltetrahydrofolate cyclo-ligase